MEQIITKTATWPLLAVRSQRSEDRKKNELRENGKGGSGRQTTTLLPPTGYEAGE